MRKNIMNMEFQGKLLDFSAGFYDVAFGVTTWDNALDPILPLFRGRGVHLFLLDRDKNLIDTLALTNNIPTSALNDFSEYYNKIDVRTRHIAEQSVGSFVRCHEICDDHYVRRSELYQDFLIPTGLRHTMGANPAQFGATSALIGLMRADEFGKFTDHELQLFRPLMHHLGRALQIQYKLQGLESSVFACEQALNALSFAVIAVGRSGYIHQANREAESLLQRLSMLHVKNQRLKGQSLAEQSTLDKLLSDAIDLGIGGGAQFSDAATLQRWHVWAVPANEAAGLFSQRMAVLAFTSGDNSPPAEALLQQVFKLTRAESRLAQALASGCSAADYADKNVISITTVRTQMRAIYEKTGVAGQTELIRLLASAGLIHA